MALKNETDPEQAAGALGAWLTDQAGKTLVTDVTIPTSSGLSNESLLFRATWADAASGAPRDERLVARIAPVGPALCPTYDLAREATVMRALAHADLPVPDVLFQELEGRVLGSPFIVMEFIGGRVPADDPPFTTAGWVTELTDTQRAVLHDSALETLAAVHNVDWRRAGLAALGRPTLGDTALDQELALWRNTYHWAAEGEVNPTIHAAFAWLEGSKPATRAEDDILTWGDARVGNMVFDEGLSVVGALDWEFAGVAPRGMDLGWWLVTERFHTDAIGVPRLGGFPAPSETIARYEELTGATVADLTFYEAFAATRLAILLHRTGNLMVRAGQLPSDSTMRLTNPATAMLAEMLDLPAPEGPTESFVGNR